MKKIALFIFLVITSVVAQTNEVIYYTGNLAVDSKAISKINISNNLSNDVQEGLKSPYLAGILSAAIPGAGEVYTKNYFKAALFFLIEGTAIYLQNYYNKKGNDQTILFKNFADENWSVVRYAEWLNQWATELGGTANISINPDESLKPWQRVNWDELNSAERTIREFSHTLYPYGHQQYYELIGKYPQYSQGWNDSKFAKGEYSIPGEYYFDTKGNFIYYSKLRGKANDYYNYANKALLVIISNHIISLIDAIISAHRYNDNLSADVTLEKTNLSGITEFYPQLNLKIRFLAF